MKFVNTYALLEDSKPRSFGGGQAVSFKIISLLKKEKIELWDSSFNSVFQKKIKSLNRKNFVFKYYSLIDNHADSGRLSERGSFSINFTRFIIELIKDFPFIIFKVIGIKAKVVFSTTKKTHLIILIASLFNNNIKKIILYHHSYYPDIFFSYIYKFVLKLLIKFLEKKVKVKHVFVSNFGLKSFTFLKKDNMSIIYNTVNNEKKLTTLRSNSKNLCLRKKKIISVYASLIPWKGIIELIKGYELIDINIRKNFPLRIYGDGIQKDLIIDLCKKVYNLSYMGFSKPENILKESCITICSSISYETCPISVLESLASGKPTFSLGIGGQNEILHKNNNFINSIDNKNLISSLVLLSNKELIKLCDMNASDYDEKYSSVIFERNIMEDLLIN